MEENTHHYLNLVASKLYKQFITGMDFEREEHRWVFDWDKNISLEENLENVASEDKALILLNNVAAIVSSSKPNYFRDQQYEAWERFGKDSGGMWGLRWEQTDPAHREYDFIRFIDTLHLDEFKAFCEEHGINYKDDKIAATLEITNQVPIIKAGGKVYQLRTLQSGLALEIIEHALSHPDEEVTFDKIRRWTGKPNAFKSQNNFKQLFRRNELGEKNILKAFARIGTKSFILNQRALLTQKELWAIQKLSTN